MRWCEERDIGFDTGVVRVPIIPAVILFDLRIGDARRRPDAAMGYAAAEAQLTITIWWWRREMSARAQAPRSESFSALSVR